MYNLKHMSIPSLMKPLHALALGVNMSDNAPSHPHALAIIEVNMPFRTDHEANNCIFKIRAMSTGKVPMLHLPS